MDTALCLADGVVYTAYQFAALRPADLESKRRHLACASCGQPGFFRSASVSGQAACFGARPHESGCPAAAPESRTIATDQDDVEPRVNPGSHIVVDMRYGAVTPTNSVQQTTPGTGSGRGNRFSGTGGAAHSAVARRRPSTLLRTLVDVEEFQHSDQIIEIPGHITGPARDVFVPFRAIDGTHEGNFCGYWGFISDAQWSDGAIWLNTGSYGDFSLVIPAELAEEFCQRHTIREMDDLAGVYVLAFEHLRVAQSGKLYVVIEELDRVVLYQPRTL